MNPALVDLGLSPFFTQQLAPEEAADDRLARVIEVQRGRIIVRDANRDFAVVLGGSWFQKPSEHRPTVGDWVLLDAEGEKISRLLDRKSIFSRLAAGSKTEVQLIAANVDTLFVVTSCNDDFNESRLERYLALALEAGVDPVIVITKADQSDNSQSFFERARSINAQVPVEVVDAREPASVEALLGWVTHGSTVALVGSSGVGKSTLVNTLSGSELTQTGGIREDDAKGRHTTSYRALYQLSGGGLLLDVPGMRELKVAELERSVAETFADIEQLAFSCRFSDCAHDREPGCAVQAAVRDGSLDERRLSNYSKLVEEEARQSLSLAELRQRERQFTKVVNQHVARKRKPAPGDDG